MVEVPVTLSPALNVPPSAVKLPELLKFVAVSPAKVEVPAPSANTWSPLKSPVTDNAPLMVEVAEDEVALKEVKVKGPVNTPAPVTAKGVPGVVVPMPTKSVEVTRVTVVPLSCQPVEVCDDELHAPLVALHTLWPCS